MESKITNNLPSKGYLIAQLTIRILAIACLLVAISTMVSNSQTVNVFGIEFQARYTYSSALRFKVGADAVVCCFLVFSLTIIKALWHPKQNSNNYFYLLLHDIVLTVLVVSGCAAATAVGLVARYGQKESGWMAICDHVSKFCDRGMLSVAFSYVSFVCLILLTIMDACKLKE